MITRIARLSAVRGSALITVLILMFMMALLTASMLKYTLTERRGNERNRLILRAKNSAENITIYAAEQLTTKLYRLGSAPVGVFPWTGTSRNRVYMPPDEVLDTAFTKHTNAEMRAGIQTASDYTLVTDTSSSNYGLQVSTAMVPIIAKASATHPVMGTVTAYVEQDMALALTPLFQFGMFYNMDLELYPSQDFTLAGPVHSNGRIMAHADGSAQITLLFTDRVTCAGGLYADAAMKTVTRVGTGAETTVVAANGHVTFTHTNGTTRTSLKNNTSMTAGLWRDHKYTTATETTTTIANFKTFATTTYNGNLRTGAHGVTKLELPGIGTYKEVNDPSTPGDDRSNGREIIEPPNAKKWVWNSGTGTGAWTANTDDPDSKESKLSWKCGLYLIVNPDDGRRSCTLPDETTAWLLPYSYRAFLNIINTSTGAHAISEVILPGQPTYGYNLGADGVAGTNDDYMYQNNLPNRYIGNTVDATNWPNLTSVGTNQILRIAQQGNAPAGTPAYVAGLVPNANPITGTGYSRTNNGGTTFPADSGAVGTLSPADAYFYDIRRANSNRGVISLSGTDARYDRFTVPYVPRAIAKIDFDMLRFKMMVDRVVSGALTSNVYDPRAPNTAGLDFTKSIFNTAGVPTAFGLGLGATFNTFPTAATASARDPFQLYYAPADPTAPLTITAINTDPRTYAVPATALASSTGNTAWYDGIAIYLHSVDAEVRAQTAGVPDRLDSGVRFWNGRGPVASLSTAGKTGFTFVTNDACYIIGHFNADGTINATDTATGNGGYSARYPDSNNEKLCAIMGDAITIVATPTWTSTASGQVTGWNDALSALPAAASSSGWRTGGSAGAALAGGQDGVYVTTGPKPGLLPTDSTPGTLGSAVTVKLGATDTEVSTALLVGIVPTNHAAKQLTDGFVQSWSHAATGDPLVVGNRVNGGGANNFPRLLDNWQPGGVRKGLFIRGSIVAMFESRVAMEPFTNSRCYLAPGRFWGLHENFRTVKHDVPLEPIVLGSTRVGFRELTASEYTAQKAVLQSLPALP